MSKASEMTKKILKEMLVENTGTHMCDSGGEPIYVNGKYVGSKYGYGRRYEINRGRDFEKEPETSLSFDDEISMELNLYHWLASRCEYDETLDKLFHGKFLEEQDPKNDKCWLELMEEFTDWLKTYEDDDGYLPYEEISGMFDNQKPLTVNSYNEENMLSQTIQFHYFMVNREEYIILQIHNGADVRGGYTTPHIFSVGHLSEYDIFDYARGGIYCTGKDHHVTALAIKEFQEKQLKIPSISEITIDIDFDNTDEHNWSTDDGYHWYEQGSCGGAYKELNTYEFKDLEEDNRWEVGKLCYYKHIGYCPICGARLAGGFY